MKILKNIKFSNNKKASVLIYAILLTTISLMLAAVLLSDFKSMSSVQKRYKIKSNLSEKIKSNNKINFENLLIVNSDGSGFIDNIGCPRNFTMSGTTVIDNDITTNLVYSGSLEKKFYCSGIFNSKNISFFFNSDYTDISTASFDNSNILLNSLTLTGTFSDLDSTFIDLKILNSYYYSDNYDDNFDSDNYLGNSTGSIEYLSGYQDNDNLARKELLGVVKLEENKNIFWNNKKIEDYIDNNPNNFDTLNTRLSQTGTGNLFLEVSSGAILTILEYDKARFNTFGEIKKIGTLTGSITGSGFIENNLGILSLSGTINSNTINFNFSGSGYLLFLNNKDSDIISYSLNGLNNSGSGIYLNPINDDTSNTGNIKILGYDVIIDNNGNIFGKMLEKVFKK